MTHPDILSMEHNGYIYKSEPPRCIGVCEYCRQNIYDDDGEAVVSRDGLFHDMDCLKEYYEIQEI